MSTFHFQQFSVSQDRCAMKVGTDGVLLGAWADLPTPASPQETIKVVDIGTGTGLIALMLAQRLSQQLAQRLAQTGQAFAITALEPETQAAAQAAENMAHSPWAAHLQVSPLALANSDFAPAGADLWVCNPPYFAQERQSDQRERRLARHSSPEFVHQFFESASQSLRPQGHIALVLPPDREETYLKIAEQWGWHCQKRCLVRHSAQHPVKRVLLDLARIDLTRTAHLNAYSLTETLCLKEMTPQGWQDSPTYARWVAPFYLRYQKPGSPSL